MVFAHISTYMLLYSINHSSLNVKFTHTSSLYHHTYLMNLTPSPKRYLICKRKIFDMQRNKIKQLSFSTFCKEAKF